MCNLQLSREPDLKVYMCSKCLSWCTIKNMYSFFLLRFFQQNTTNRFCNMHVDVLLEHQLVPMIVHLLEQAFQISSPLFFLLSACWLVTINLSYGCHQVFERSLFFSSTMGAISFTNITHFPSSTPLSSDSGVYFN